MRTLLRAVCAGLLLAGLAGCRGEFIVDPSPDGRTVACYADGLKLVDVNTGAARPIARDGAAPAWAPDGKSLVYMVVKPDQPAGTPPDTRLYTVATGKSTPLAGCGGWPFAWREDSARVAGFRTLPDGTSEAVWYSVADHGVTFRAKVPTPQSVIALWLPGTDDIAYVGSTGDKGSTKADVYTVEAGEVHRITNTGDVIGLGFTADRKKLMWVRRSPNPRYILLSVYTYDLTDRSSARVTFPERVRALNPDTRHAPQSVEIASISPDGRRMALVVGVKAASEPKTGKARTAATCYIVNMDGTSALLVRRAGATTDSGASNLLIPYWSRDGKHLALFDSTDSGSVWVYQSDATGGKQVASRVAPRQ